MGMLNSVGLALWGRCEGVEGENIVVSTKRRAWGDRDDLRCCLSSG